MPEGSSRILVDTSGKRWKLDDPSHKVVLIEFWATTCGPCIDAMPALHAMFRDLQPRGLVMISVNADGTRERAARFLKQRPFPNPVVLDDGTAWRSWGVTKLPTMILLREGRVLRQWEGAASIPEVSAAARTFL